MRNFNINESDIALVNTRASQYGIALVDKRKGHVSSGFLDFSQILKDLSEIDYNKNTDELKHKIFLDRLDRNGSSFVQRKKIRIISVPDEATKERQRIILRRLERIPIHRSAFGFVRGRGPQDCAAAHLAFHGTAPRGLMLLNVDVQDFFHSISEHVVKKALLGHGIPEAEADLIIDHCMLRADSGILCLLVNALKKKFSVGVDPEFVSISSSSLSVDAYNRVIAYLMTEDAIGDNMEHKNRYRTSLLHSLLGVGNSIHYGERFLPQGAPTSPFLANLSCKLIDIRLEAMAKAFGAFYTRYADDFVFSWKIPPVGKIKGKTIDGLRRCAAEVIAEYGLLFNPKKIRSISPKYAQDVVGYLINSGRPTIHRGYRDRVRQEVKNLSIGRNVPEREIQRLRGCTGYIASAHPEEAKLLQGLINQYEEYNGDRMNSFQYVTHSEYPEEEEINVEQDEIDEGPVREISGSYFDYED